MNLGKTLFAQLMEFVPWSSFARIVTRYSGDARVSALPSTEHFRIMAYAQLTWRESLRDIEVTLAAHATKLYGMGLRQAVRRATLADANERRNWRMWADLAAVLIGRANKLYADEPLGLDVNIAGKVYALDSSTIDLCLNLFDWAPYRTNCPCKPEPSTSWSGAMWTSRGCTQCIRGVLSLSVARNPISMPDVCIRPRWKKPRAWCAIRPWRSTAARAHATIPSICVGCASKTRKPARP